METLVVAEPVETAEGGRILLRHEPIPQSVRIDVNGIVYYPRPAYGFRLQGNVIETIDDVLRKVVEESAPKGGVTVEYLRRLSTDRRG